MSAWLNGKVDDQGKPVCPRCGAPSSETSMLCEQHRIEAAERWSRWSAKHRPARREDRKCAFCAAPSATYRCSLCKEKRRRWDAGRPIGDLRAAAAPSPDPAATAPAGTAGADAVDGRDSNDR